MEATRIFDLLDRYSNNYKDKIDAFGAKENGEWIKYSSNDYVTNANIFKLWLISAWLKTRR